MFKNTATALLISFLLVSSSHCVRLYLIASNNSTLNGLLREVSPKQPFVLDFVEMQVSWRFCNIHSGSFTTNPAQNVLFFGLQISTKIACTEIPAQLDSIVEQFFQSNPVRYRTTYDDNLHYLTNRRGQTLIFVDTAVVN